MTQAAIVGQSSVSTSSTIWASSGNFSTIYAISTTGSQTHTITAPEQITALSLASKTHFIISDPTAAITGANLTALVNWVAGGGTLMFFAGDSSSITNVNTMLAGFGTGTSGAAMSVGGLLNSALDPFTPLNLGSLSGTGVSAGLSTLTFGSYGSPFTVSGGTALGINTIASIMRVDTFQLGSVYVFGGQFASNANLSISGNSNAQFFLNLLAQGNSQGGGGGGEAPEPGTVLLMGAGLGAILMARKKLAR